MEELTGNLSWPEPEVEYTNRRRSRREEVAAGRDGKPLVPQDFGSDESTEQAEAEVGELLQRIFVTPVDGLKPEWQRTFELSVVRDARGMPQVERGTYAPLLASLRDTSSWLAAEGIRVTRGMNAGKEVRAWQVQEWKLRVGIPKLVRYFFELHPDVLQAYLAKREESGERAIPHDKILQRFSDGVIRLLRGQKNGRHQAQ